MPPEDTRQRALKTIGMLRDNGVQHVRTHIDVTDPSLTALKAMLKVKKEAAHLIDLQIVAFPQEGIESFPGKRELMTRAIEMGATWSVEYHTTKIPGIKVSVRLPFLWA